MATSGTTSNVKLMQLFNHLQAICEAEHLSSIRHSQILENLDEFETKIAAIRTKAEKLSLEKDEYVKLVRHNFPLWMKEKTLKAKVELKTSTPVTNKFRSKVPLEFIQSKALTLDKMKNDLLENPHVKFLFSQEHTNHQSTFNEPNRILGPKISSTQKEYHEASNEINSSVSLQGTKINDFYKMKEKELMTTMNSPENITRKKEISFSDIESQKTSMNPTIRPNLTYSSYSLNKNVLLHRRNTEPSPKTENFKPLSFDSLPEKERIQAFHSSVEDDGSQSSGKTKTNVLNRKMPFDSQLILNQQMNIDDSINNKLIISNDRGMMNTKNKSSDLISETNGRTLINKIVMEKENVQEEKIESSEKKDGKEEVTVKTATKNDNEVLKMTVTLNKAVDTDMEVKTQKHAEILKDNLSYRQNLSPEVQEEVEMLEENELKIVAIIEENEEKHHSKIKKEKSDTNEVERLANTNLYTRETKPSSNISSDSEDSFFDQKIEDANSYKNIFKNFDTNPESDDDSSDGVEKEMAGIVNEKEKIGDSLVKEEIFIGSESSIEKSSKKMVKESSQIMNFQASNKPKKNILATLNLDSDSDVALEKEEKGEHSSDEFSFYS